MWRGVCRVCVVRVEVSGDSRNGTNLGIGRKRGDELPWDLKKSSWL